MAWAAMSNSLIVGKLNLMELKKMKSIIVSVVAAAGLMAAGSVLATDMPELAKKSGCTACHKIDSKLVGPAWMDVSKKYKGVKEYAYSPTGSAAAGAKKMSLEEGLMMKVAKGGTGNWGSVPMTANSPKVSDADIKTLVHFVLDLAK
ncbi:MAG: cytochrome c [Candidatus Nitrotoga sp. LAW]|nr:MAG: cytochrome c [Candidatus Nitrotoga sp. LAW]